ncbi:MAG: DUF3558 domain-containing protein [Acidobacteriota bacterium]|nr:DUF3558 domain-containing protein [Acidobacteriota bacterium]
MRGRPVLRRMVFAGFVLLLASAVAYDLRAEGAAPCAAWLTAAEVRTALGVELETVEPVEYSPGFTVCSWTKDRPEGQLGVNLSFFELKAIREGMVSAESIPEYFDLQVSSTQERSGVEPQELAEVGKRAVLFSEEALWIVMIELEEGFAHLAISPGDVARAQVEAMAKAVDSRANK